MLRYMLDTDICSLCDETFPIYFSRRPRNGSRSAYVCVSVVTKSELLYGVEVSPRRQQDEAGLNAFLNYVEVLDFPDTASSHYAQIRGQLKKSEEDDWSERSLHRRPRPQPGLGSRPSRTTLRKFHGSTGWRLRTGP